MTRLSEMLNKIFRWIVLSLFGIFILYLTILSLFSTNYCFVGQKALFVSDTPYKALFFYVFIIAVFAMIRYKNIEQGLVKYEALFLKIWNIIIFSFMLYLIITTQLHPHGDQLAISNAAVGLRKYDFYQFGNESYFVYWPFQSRIVVFLWGFFILFGNYNYLAFQIMNAVCILVSLNLLAEMTSRVAFQGSRGMRTLIFFGCSLFVPFLLYSTYIYGNIVGLTFIFGSIYALMCYFEEHKTGQLAAVILCCGIGVWLKNTYLIFMIAILIFLLMDFWRSYKWISLLGIAGVIASVSLMGQISDALIERRLGFPLSEGSPMIAWITMAFGQEEDGTPVKFDGYNRDVYLENDLDTKKAEKAAKEELQRRIAGLLENPGHFAEFMGKKIAMEWNEPTFESLVANNRPEAQIEKPFLTERLLQQDNRSPVVKYANLFHSLIFLGALSWLACKGKKEKLQYLFAAVVFIGGFLFQLFWETYSQYTLQYFLLLIPYAISGYLAMAELVCGCLEKKRPEKRMLFGAGSILLVLFLIAVLPLPVFSSLFKIDRDDAAYAEQLALQVQNRLQQEGILPNGSYRVLSAAMDGYGIVPRSEAADETGLAFAKCQNSDDGIMYVYHEYGYDTLRLRSSQLLLSVEAAAEDENYPVGQDYDYAMWKIIEAGEAGYAILCNGGDADGQALTAEDGKLLLAPFCGKPEQIWRFEPK